MSFRAIGEIWVRIKLIWVETDFLLTMYEPAELNFRKVFFLEMGHSIYGKGRLVTVRPPRGDLLNI